jgi:DNA-binding transcriptional ArsR family regulator
MTVMRRPVRIITDPKIAHVLVDPMRREIVRLLAEGQKTENDLARLLGLSDASVGHHLKVLREMGLIRMARREAEEHGILQKFYESNATVYLIDWRKMPKEIDRYFMPISLERIRGIMTGANYLMQETTKVSEKEVEDFARAYASALTDVSSKFRGPLDGGREELMAALYRKALTHILRNQSALPENIRRLLTTAFRS